MNHSLRNVPKLLFWWRFVKSCLSKTIHGEANWATLPPWRGMYYTEHILVCEKDIHILLQLGLYTNLNLSGPLWLNSPLWEMHTYFAQNSKMYIIIAYNSRMGVWCGVANEEALTETILRNVHFSEVLQTNSLVCLSIVCFWHFYLIWGLFLIGEYYSSAGSRKCLGINTFANRKHIPNRDISENQVADDSNQRIRQRIWCYIFVLAW